MDRIKQQQINHVRMFLNDRRDKRSADPYSRQRLVAGCLRDTLKNEFFHEARHKGVDG
jgi:hypothetical protein